MALKSSLILLFYRGIFNNQSVTWQGKQIPLEKVNGLRAFKNGPFLFIEQNPKKNSIYAQKAKAGSQIMWLINTKLNSYFAVVIDGRLIYLK